MALVFAFLKSYWLYAVSVLVGAWLAWLVQEIRLDGVKVEFATYKAQVEQQAVEARYAALKQKEAWIKEKEDAEVNAVLREAQLRSERDRAVAAGRRLRDDLTTLRTRLPHAIPSAVLATADTLAGVLDQCQSDYRALAEVCDGHASDVQTLMEAWPK